MSLGVSFLESLVAGGEDEKILNDGEMKRRQGNLMCISLCWLLFLRSPYNNKLQSETNSYHSRTIFAAKASPTNKHVHRTGTKTDDEL